MTTIDQIRENDTLELINGFIGKVSQLNPYLKVIYLLKQREGFKEGRYVENLNEIKKIL